MNQVFRAVGWNSYGNTPDYFNSCAPESTFANVPSNFFGYQTSLNGNAYAGFWAFSDAGTDFREVVGCPLSAALVIGQKYYITFYVVNAGTVPGPGLNCCVNKIGMRFSTVSYSSINSVPIDNFAHVYTDSTIKDTINWYKISGSFIADSSYQYLSISNFFSDTNTDTTKFNTWACESYYLVDGICVSTDSLFSETWLSSPEINLENDFKIYPNPSSGLINIKCYSNLASIKIYNLLGEIVYTSNKLSIKIHDPYIINLSEFPPGIYLVNLSNDKISITKKIIIN